ncbi:MAG: alpha/beta hydrolase [Janthinobacterium lividum]
MYDVTGGAGPHAGQSISITGPSPGEAKTALILVHGRGGSAADMLGLAAHIAGPTMACLAPQAADHTWYPYRFTEPVARNEPYLGSALSMLGALMDQLREGGLPPERIGILGFSQGACLALEFAVRRRLRLGALIGLSGGLIGDTIVVPPATNLFQAMPVVLGCSEQDTHIPAARVLETDAVLRALGAEVTTRLYSGSSHDVNGDEIAITRQVLAGLEANTFGLN